jgi:hypothetical protein
MNIKELAEQAGLRNTLGCFWQCGDHDLKRFAELVAAAEREECAQLCEDLFNSDGNWCAKSIRARGAK